MAASVGEIGLDLVVNRNGFDRQMRGITGLAKKAAAALAGAFAIGKLVEFGKQCLELGSDLAEVQNVVDVTFPAMSAQVNDFAKKAATAFGLSETMAKRYTGTFGAMAKAFGFSEQAAYEMGTTLTGLSGDVASFYNISQDEAYTKLKAVFTGETEELKELGIVITQNALDAYAMANGYGKVTAKMTEAEKVALRYKFLQDQLALATGDFARTSDGWANQVRILKLQFDSLKATLGQGLINLFTPIIKGVNVLLGKLTTLANAFKSFTELLTGKKSSGMSSPVSDLSGSASDASQGLTDAAGSAGNLADNTSGVGKAAKKAAKEMKALMGFDAINKLDDTSDSEDESGGGTAGGGGAAAGSPVDYGNLAEGETVLDALSNKFKPLIDRAKELADLFKQGFVIGFGDSAARIDSIKAHLGSIKDSLKEIFTDSQVVEAAKRMIDSIVFSLGELTGAFVSVGITIIDNLVGGIDKYLQESKGYIKERLISIFDVSGEIVGLAGKFSAAFADIFSVFSGDSAKSCTASIIGIFSDGLLGVLDLGLRFGKDLIRVIIDPIVENKDKIKEALENTLAPLSEVLDSIHGLVKDTFIKMSEVYDTYLEPAFNKIKDGFSDLVGTILDTYNSYIAPALQSMADKFHEVVEQKIQPLLDTFIECIGKIASAIAETWDETLEPFVAWLIDKFGSVLGSIISGIGDAFLDAFGGLCDILTPVFDILSKIGDWIVDNQDKVAQLSGAIAAFTLVVNANKIAVNATVLAHTLLSAITGAWTGIAGLATAATSALGAAFAFLTSPIGIIALVIATVVAAGIALYQNWDVVKEKALEIWGSIKDWFGSTTEKIREFFSELWEGIKEKFSDVGEWFREKFAAAREGIYSVFGSIGEWFSERWQDIKNVFSNVADWFRTTFGGALDAAKEIFGKIIDFLHNVFTGNWEEAWEGIKSIFGSVWDSIAGIVRGPVNTIIDFLNGLLDGCASVVNGIADMFNSLSIDVPEGVPIVGGKNIGFNLPHWNPGHIPKLAQGGYVKPNTPQLAMIGDNRHQGEVVAPEDKLLNMALQAAKLAGNSTSPEVITLLKEILLFLKNRDVVSIDEESLRKYFIKKTNKNTKATGRCELVT